MMHIKLNSLILIVTLICTLFGTASSQPQTSTPPAQGNLVLKVTQVNTSNFPKVVVYISAIDSSGNPVVVNPNELVLEENGQEVKTDLVAGAGESGPLTTMLVIDISGSMNTSGKLSMAKKVAEDYITQMRSNDMAGVIAFNNKVNTIQAITADHDALTTSIDMLKAGDDTAIYDALLKAVDLLNPLPGRKAIIVLTDGLDNRSTNKPSDVIKAIGQSGLSISTIGLGNPGQSTGNITALDEKTLSALAENAGGSYGLATDQATLKQIYEKYGRTLRSEYAITYTSQSTLRDGLNRSLMVSLQSGGITAWPGTVQTKFNPGGVVPEVATPASWVIFFTLLAGLIVLLLLPNILSRIKKPTAPVPQVPVVPAPKATRVKLK
jgi:Ca-activated chloride channel homolog